MRRVAGLHRTVREGRALTFAVRAWCWCAGLVGLCPVVTVAQGLVPDSLFTLTGAVTTPNGAWC